MVRAKFRWLLVKFDFEDNMKLEASTERNEDNTNLTITEKDIIVSLREEISSSFGVFGSGNIGGVQCM